VVPPPPEPDEPDEAEPSAEPESAGDDEAEAPAEPPKPKARSSVQTGGKRASNQVVTLEMVRDAVVDKFGPGKPFNSVMLGEAMGVNPITLRKYIKELYEKGILKRTGGRGGPTVKYEYDPPDPRSGPRERPRHDGPRQTVKGTEHLKAIEGGRGKAVAHTGRTVGRSGKPGRDKKKAELGFRVKAKGK
jgi:hypothetical protein